MARRKTALRKRSNVSGTLLQRLQGLWSRQGNILELLLPQGWPETRGLVHWRLRGAPGVTPHGQVTSLNEIPGVGAMTRVQIWAPPSSVLLTSTSLPTRSRAKIQQALPFALEDQLVGEPDKLHFAYRIQEDNSLAVAVTGRDRLQTWIAKLSESGMRPSGICPAQLALPFYSGSWTLAFHANEIWVRTGVTSGFACTASGAAPPVMLKTALREASEKDNAPQNLTVLQPPSRFDAKVWESVLNVPISGQKLDFWANHQEPVPAINLLQGSFAPASQVRELAPALKPAAILFAVWLVGSLGFDVWEWWQLKNTHNNLRQEMTNLFRRTFPEAKTVVDPALQMERLVREMQGKSGKGSSTDMLPLLGNAATVIQGSTELKLRGIQFSESRLTLDVTLPDFQTMENIKNAFSARGMQVDVVGANSTTAGIEGRLRLTQSQKAGS